MIFGLSFIIGLLSGITATLIAGNPHARFYVEKSVRKLFKKPLLAIKLVSFTNYCKDGLLLVHCIELRNAMWFTNNITRVYFLSRGTFDYDAHAYKPFVYFKSRGMYENKLDYKLSKLLEKFSSRIIPYSPDDPKLGMNMSRNFPVRIAVVCELIDSNKVPKNIAMNHLKIVGELYAAVANPMPKVSPGGSWDMSIISEDFGLMDMPHITIPKDLEKKEPLGDSSDALEMTDRPPCLMDLEYVGYTWPLRFNINNCEIRIKGGYPKKIQIIRPKTKIRSLPLLMLRRLLQHMLRKKLRHESPGIKIQ